MELITLKNKDKATLVKDVVMRPLKINKDESGVLVETLRKDWPDICGPGREFTMQYYSVTPPGLARDEDVWHFHPTVQEDRFLVISGEIVMAIADTREGSATKGLLNLFHMRSDNDPYILLVPKNTLHGFMVASKTPATLVNFPTALYSPKEEGRIPYAQAQVKTEDGALFSWNAVRKNFENSPSQDAQH
ncbi:MAG: dTDP-4-dehydrorhamnose 3,5-epimerase family protein [Candidatus Levybacteria bacterium]|nr:dTDP-4-dehydrorhamnose 3,5-epimerase family protein [Candidatus Levybacteria bacterium]